MKLNRFWYEPKAEIEFTRQDADLLMKLSAAHYDGMCEALSRKESVLHRPGGFTLYALRNKIEMCSGIAESWEMTSREIDLLRKVLEIANYHWLEPEEGARASAMFTELGRVFSQLQREYRGLNRKP